MNLTLTSIINHYDGLHYIYVTIDGNEYMYTLKYQQDVDKFNKFYNQGYKGRALNELKRNNVKEGA